MPQKPFKGIIKLDVRDSVADWDALPADEGARRCAEHPVRAVRRHRAGRLVALRRPHQHADAAEARRQRPDVFAVAHHGALLADPLDAPDRAQPPPERHGRITEGANGFPGATRPHPAECATIGAAPAGQRLEHVLGGQEPQRARDRTSPRARQASSGRCSRASTASTDSSAARPTSGIPTWSRTTTSSSSRTRPRRAITCRRTWPIRPSRCSATSRPTNPSQALVHVVLPGRQPRPAPCAAGIHRQVQGQVRRRLRGLPRVGAAPDDREGHPAGGHRSSPRSTRCRRTWPNAGDMVRPWDSLNADEKKLFSRLMEVYAGFSEYTDAQVGRIIDYLEQTGQLDNTIVIYAADNGASGEGSPNGSVNENKFFNGYPDELAENMKLIDRLGGPDTYEHYPTGWAVAMSTPFKMFKRYSEYAGGTCDPMVISLAEGHQGQRRDPQPVPPRTDIVPTILDVCGLEMPKVYSGVEQYPLSGVSMRYSFDDADAPTQKKRQYYAMLGTRGIWEDGWKAVAMHAPTQRQGPFRQGRVGALPRRRGSLPSRRISPTSTPRSSRQLIDAWFEEADKNLVLPLDDRTRVELLNDRAALRRAASRSLHLLPGHVAGPGRRRRQHTRPLVQDPRRRRDHRSELHAASSSPTAPASADTRCSSRTRSCTTSTTSSASRRNSSSSRRVEAGQVHARHGVRAGERRRVSRVAWHDQTVRQRQGRGRGTDARASRASSPCAETAFASAATVVTRSASSTSPQERSRAAPSWASPSRSRRRSISTSRRWRRRVRGRLATQGSGEDRRPLEAAGLTSSPLTKPIGWIQPGYFCGSQPDDHHMLSSRLQELEARRRSCLEYPFDARRRPTLMTKRSRRYLCDWPDCPNIAEHVVGVIVELRQFVAVCSEHGRLAKAPKTHQSGG